MVRGGCTINARTQEAGSGTAGPTATRRRTQGRTSASRQTVGPRGRAKKRGYKDGFVHRGKGLTGAPLRGRGEFYLGVGRGLGGDRGNCSAIEGTRSEGARVSVEINLKGRRFRRGERIRGHLAREKPDRGPSFGTRAKLRVLGRRLRPRSRSAMLQTFLWGNMRGGGAYSRA